MEKNPYAGIIILLFGACRICVGFVVPESDLLLQSLLLVHGLFPEGAVSLHLRRGTTGLGDNPR